MKPPAKNMASCARLIVSNSLINTNEQTNLSYNWITLEMDKEQINNKKI